MTTGDYLITGKCTHVIAGISRYRHRCD